MKQYLINYIKKLTKEDIIKYAYKQNITLNNDELNIIYNTIKKDYQTFMFDNPIPILNSLKNNLRPNTYQKIEELYNKYKHLI